MPNDEVVRYVDQARVAGIDDSSIRQMLLGQGWSDADVDAALQTSAAPAQPVSAPLATTPIKKLSKTFVTAIVIVIAAVAAGAYLAFAKYAIHTWPFGGGNAQFGSSSPTSTSSSSSGQIAQTPATASSTLEARVIEVYPNRQVMTVQTTDGGEEIVIAAGSSSLPESLMQGTELEVNVNYDQSDDLYFLNSLSMVASGSLQFQIPLSDPIGRAASATKVDASGLNLSFGASLRLPKPAYLVFLSPDGEVLAPHFTSMPGAEYSVDGDLDNVTDTLQASQYITIPIASRGLWAVKFVSLPGADTSTIFGFTPPLPAMTLGQRDDKLWYFDNVPLDTIGKIQAGLAQCDSTCRVQLSKPSEPAELLLGELADPSIQQELFGKVGTPYTIEGYGLQEPQVYFGGITCAELYQSTSSSISAYRISLTGWEESVLANTAGVCNLAAQNQNGQTYGVWQVINTGAGSP